MSTATEKTRQLWGKRPFDGARVPVGTEVVRTAWCEGCRKWSKDFGGVVSAGWLFKCAGRKAEDEKVLMAPHFFVAEAPDGDA